MSEIDHIYLLYALIRKKWGRYLRRKLVALLFLCALPLLGQSNSGELRLKVTDPSHLGVKTTVHILSEGNNYQKSLATSSEGTLDVQHLPYGVYQLTIRQTGFAPAVDSIQIHSPLPTDKTISLELPTVNQSVTVRSVNTLLDPHEAGSVNHIGTEFIKDRLTSIPGRSLQDLINSQPGWLYEGNAVLHPRGSEYQTQFVIDGIPLTDNRSPSFGPAIEAEDVQSINIYTAGIPAEYGRKMGGVIEINTQQDSQPGLHGKLVLSGGSFDSASAFAEAQYTQGKNTIGGSASGSRTGHYLNPVVPQNYSNTGTLGDFSIRDEDNLTPNDRINLSVRHETARYDIPNELIQQAAGQRQTADNIETMGIASYHHILSPNALIDFHGMVRNNANDFHSNPSKFFSTIGFGKDISMRSGPSIADETSGNSASSRTICFSTKTSATTLRTRHDSIPTRPALSASQEIAPTLNSLHSCRI